MICRANTILSYSGLTVWNIDVSGIRMKKTDFLTKSFKLRTFRSEQEAVACCEEKNKQPADLKAIFLDIDLLRRELDQIEDT